MLARAGQRLETFYTDPWAECRAWEELIKTRTFDTAGSHRQFISLRRQWLEDADLINFNRTSRINICFDLKRRPVNVRDKGGIIAFETVPWTSVEEFSRARDAFDSWRTDIKRVLMTARDWQDYTAWAAARPGRRAAGVRGTRPRIVTLFMRAYARGELGFPGRNYPEAAAFITNLGWKTSATNIKDAKRRGRLALNQIDMFTQDEIKFIEMVSKRWPQSRMRDLLKK